MSAARHIHPAAQRRADAQVADDAERRAKTLGRFLGMCMGCGEEGRRHRADCTVIAYTLDGEPVELETWLSARRLPGRVVARILEMRVGEEMHGNSGAVLRRAR